MSGHRARHGSAAASYPSYSQSSYSTPNRSYATSSRKDRNYSNPTRRQVLIEEPRHNASRGHAHATPSGRVYPSGYRSSTRPTHLKVDPYSQARARSYSPGNRDARSRSERWSQTPNPSTRTRLQTEARPHRDMRFRGSTRQQQKHQQQQQLQPHHQQQHSQSDPLAQETQPQRQQKAKHDYVLEWEQKVEIQQRRHKIEALSQRLSSMSLSEHDRDTATKELEEHQTLFNEERKLLIRLQTNVHKIEAKVQSRIDDMSVLKSMIHGGIQKGISEESFTRIKREIKKHQVLLENITLECDAITTQGLTDADSYRQIRKDLVRRVQKQLALIDEIEAMFKQTEKLYQFTGSASVPQSQL